MTEPECPSDGAGPRPSFQDYLARMNMLGFKPSRRLGQNFLLDADVHRRIVDAAAPAQGDVALEIGAGLGFLTRELVVRCRHVIAVEIDPRLHRILQEDIPGYGAAGEIRLLHCDALGGAGGTLHPDIQQAIRGMLPVGGDLRVVANLPYAVSGPLMAELVAMEPLPAAMAVLVQKELAQRFAAPPGGGERGSLSVLLQSLFKVRLERNVGRAGFRPRPQVDSAICSLVVDPDAPLAGASAAIRRRAAVLIRGLFQQRRKRLQAVAEKALVAAGVPDAKGCLAAWPEVIRTARPQELGPGEWRRILADLEREA